MKTLVIASEDAVIGFSLAGVQGKIVATAEETLDAFEQAIKADNQVGVLLITEPVAKLIRKQVDGWIIGGRQPLIVEIPDVQGPLEGRRTPHEFVKSAIGVKF